MRTRVTPSNLMLMPVDSRDRPRHETTVADTRFVARRGGGGGTIIRAIREIMQSTRRAARKLCAPPRRGSRASPDLEGCANDAHDRHVRGARVCSGNANGNFSLVGLNWRSSLSGRTRCVRRR